MKNRRCMCGNQLHPEKRKALEIRVSRDTCDMYGCPGYINEQDNGWSFHTAPQRPYTKYNSRPIGSTSKTEGNVSVLQYFFDALGKSSINGISNCSSSTTIIGKLIWLVVFIACVSGFSYQASHFYDLYRNKPSVVQIEVENDGEVDFPAVTVCNLNRIRKSAFCKYFSDECNSGVNTLSEYEINNKMYDLLLNKQEDVRKELGHTMSMFVSCTFIGTPIVKKNECLSIWDYFYDPDYGNCYTFTSKNKENKVLQARKVDFWQEENDLTLTMDAEPEEFMERHRNPGLMLVVHDERALPDLHTDGLMLAAGFSYTITTAKVSDTYFLIIANLMNTEIFLGVHGIKKISSATTVILLPPPYKTNCTDYLSLPWQRVHDRRLTSRLCTVGCSQHFQFDACQLVTKNLSLFYKSLPYDKTDFTEEKMNCSKDQERNTIHYCRSICGLPCRESLYSTTVATSRLSDKELSYDLAHRDQPNMSIYDDIIQVRIFYSTLEHKIFRHIPKYDTMELFSFLGGYSGVWLGFSLLTVYELFEIIVSTVLYFFRKKQRQNHHRKFLRTLMSSRKHTKTTVKSYKRKKHYR